MICQDFEHLFYPILNAVRISQDFEQLSGSSVEKIGRNPNLQVIKAKRSFIIIVSIPQLHQPTLFKSFTRIAIEK